MRQKKNKNARKQQQATPPMETYTKEQNPLFKPAEAADKQDALFAVICMVICILLCILIVMNFSMAVNPGSYPYY